MKNIIDVIMTIIIEVNMTSIIIEALFIILVAMNLSIFSKNKVDINNQYLVKMFFLFLMLISIFYFTRNYEKIVTYFMSMCFFYY